MGPLRYVLIGTGGFGAWWCRAFLPPLAELGKAHPVAAVDLDPSALVNAQQHLGLDEDRCYTDLSQALEAHEADFAVIVVPPAFHEGIVDAALAHGLHILSEKPIADSIDACCRIHDKVSDAGRKMAVTMSHRFDQDKQTLARAVGSGGYGPLHYVVARFTYNLRGFGAWGKFRHEIPDTLIVEGAVHHFDIFREITRSDARTVYAQTWNPPWGEYAGDTTALVNIQMTNGVRCFYEGAKANASTLNGWGLEYFRAECRDATIELDQRKVRLLRSPQGLAPDVEEIALQEQPRWTNAWLAELFCDWLQGGPPPPNHLGDNMQCAALTFAAIESSRRGQVVDVQAFLAEAFERSRA